MFIEHLGGNCIKRILADRDFVGKDWFGWLLKEKIPFYIRIKNNTITTNAKGLKVDIDELFYGLESDYFDGCLPACAGMTGFFAMYRAKH